MSYTNKDFQTIYPELLEVAKNLAKNWDPTISNESDPGVVLLKLSAIIGDKNNYNIDKNVLENYPETYTQEVSARSQYRQLGYKMPWYRAATLPVTFRWVGEELSLGQYVTIPKHTLLTDSSGEYVFTLLEDVDIIKRDYSTSLMATGKAMQGVINRLSLVGSDIINLSHLDSNNRLYINDSNVAENGIFVRNSGSDVLWDQVYNVETQSPNSKCYEFDVDQRKNCPYIQFPDDIYSTIENGLVIEYITTDGYAGNVAANTIDSYFNELTVGIKSIDLSVETISVPLNTDNVKVFNTYATTETTEDLDINVGSDPETIEEARISYKKIVGTFDTLVTLRDYMSAIYMMNPAVASNVVVTDRTNDIQCSYRIVSKYPSVSSTTTYMTGDTRYVFRQGKTDDTNNTYVINENHSFIRNESPEEGENIYHLEVEKSDDMTPFDLKLYLLKNSETLPMIDPEKGILKYSDSTMDAYDNTFDVDNSANTKKIIDISLAESKSIQHDFVDIKPSLPFMLQAVYPIKLKIIPTYKLDDTHKAQVESNIKSTLIQLLNSKKCEFGTEPDYNVIYGAIAGCDERIKTVIMDDFVYTLFAVYMEESGEFKYVPVSDYSTCDRAIIVHTGANNDTSTSEVLRVLGDKLSDLKENEGTIVLEDYIFIDAANGIMYKAEVDDDNKASLVMYSDRLQEIRKQIIAKNVLAGVTPLYDVNDNTFTTTVDMQQIGSESAKNIRTDLEIHPFGIGSEYSPNDRVATYTLKENESIRCLAPSFVMDKSFSSYTKFEVTLKNPITSTESYVLADPKDEDSIINRYGYSMFRKRTSDGVYEKATSSPYLKLDTTPRYKLDSYYRKVNRGQGTEYDIIKVDIDSPINLENAVKDAAKRSAFEFEFESNLYYTEVDGRFVPISEYPYSGDKTGNWGPAYYTSCYKLRQVVTDKIYLDLRSYINGNNGIIINSVNDIINKVEGKLYADDDKGNRVAVTIETGDTDPSYTDAYHYLDSDSYTGSYDYFVEISGDLSSTNRNITFDNNYPESYIKLGHYGTNVYKVIKDTKGTIIGYEMVMLKDLENFADNTKFDSNATYIEVKYPDVWNPDNYSIRYFDNKTQNEQVISSGLKFSNIVYVPNKPVNPDGTDKTLYIFEDNTYKIKQPNMADWMNTYTDYYTKETFDGIHPNSTEYTSWLSQASNLYVPDVTYKIPADTEYQLRDGDCVKFFWRDADESDAPYNYECYKGTDEFDSPIIKANFTITAKSFSDEIINSTNLGSSGKIPYDMGTDSNYYKIYYNMSGGEDDLGASRSIEIRRINQVRMIIDGDCKNRYYYVVTNNTVKEDGKKYYKLVLDKVSSSTDRYRYKHILQPDEYFFYVNEDRTLYGVLGEGTLIDFTTTEDNDEGIVLRSEAISATDIAFKGISAFKDQCKEISKDDDIRLIEQQVYSFTKGDILQFNLKQDYDYIYEKATDYDENTDYFTNVDEYKKVEPISVSSNRREAPPFIPNYYYKKDGDEYKLCLSEPENWYDETTNDNSSVTFGCSNYYYLYTGGFESAQDVSSDNVSNYYVRISPEYPVIKTSSPLLIDNVDVYYSVEGTNGESSSRTYTQLPAINVKDDEYKWSVTSYLNLNMSPHSAQKIPVKDNQSISSVKIGEIEYDGGTATEDMYLMSDVQVCRTGGSNVDISWTSMNGETRSTKIFAYHINKAVSEDNGFKHLVDNDEIEYAINKSEDGTIIIDGIQLDLSRNYMLPIELMTDELSITELHIKRTGSTDYIPWSDVCCGNMIGKGKHFISLPGNTIGIEILYSNTSEDKESVIKFHKMLKYTERELFGGGKATSPKYGITTSDILAEISKLDIPEIFDYCYIPSLSERILDPLDPVSVFNGNHVFNKFSIPRAELRTDSPYSSEIDFVNNR